MVVATSARADEDVVLVPEGATWRYAVASQAGRDWTLPGFDDAAWQSGPAGFGFGDDDDATDVHALMRPDTTSGQPRAIALRVRIAFDMPQHARDVATVLRVAYDDGFVAFLDGAEIAHAGIVGDAPDSAAADHEARRVEDFPLDATLAPGRHVLAIEVHDSSLDSTDLSLRPSLVLRPKSSPATTTTTSKRHEPVFATTVAGFHVSNFFQGINGTPKESVTGEVLRQEVRFDVREKGRGASGLLRVEGQRYGSLGTSPAAFGRFAWTTPKASVQLDLEATWNRPTYKQGDDVSRDDTRFGEVLVGVPVSRSMSWAAWTSRLAHDSELDSRRDLHDTTLGTGVRFLRRHHALSPELGIEETWRDARDAVFDYAQLRAFLRLHSAVHQARITSLLRWAERDYDAPAGSANADRQDHRRLVRVVTTAPVADAWDLTGFLSWEDGTSSGVDRAFDSWTTWIGMTWRTGTRSERPPSDEEGPSLPDRPVPVAPRPPGT